MRLSLLMCSWMLCGLAACQTTPAPRPKAPVAFHFKWPVGTAFDVSVEREVPGAPTYGVTHRFSWHAERHRDGLLITPKRSHAAGHAELSAYWQRRAVPAFVVDAWGQVVGLDDKLREQQRIEGALVLALPDAMKGHEQVVAIEAIDLVTHDERDVRTLWTVLVGALAERQLHVGDVDVANVRVGDTEWQRHVEVRAVRACGTEERPAVCAEVGVRLRHRGHDGRASMPGESDAVVVVGADSLTPLQLELTTVRDVDAPTSLLQQPLPTAPVVVHERYVFRPAAVQAVDVTVDDDGKELLDTSPQDVGGT